MTPTRIVIADDHAMMRDGLRAVIELEDGLDVVGEAGTGHEAIEQAERAAPHIIIMDIGMPDLNGIEATRQITSRNGPVRIIALSVHADQQYVVEMLKAGASAYLLKRSASEELVRAIHTVMNGRTYLSPEVAGGVIDQYVRHHGSDPGEDEAFETLTQREREVLQVLAEGKTTKEIAADLGVSIKTVETHRRNIMQKLDLHSVAELTKYAVRQGITQVE